MEILRFENAPARKARKKSSTKTLLGLSAVAAVAVFGSTLAANISLNSGGTVEFGQGVSQTTACDSDGITVTPVASFTNSAGNGEFNLKTIELAGVASTCSGKTFTLQAYGDSNASALQIATVSSAAVTSATIGFNTTTTSQTVQSGFTLENKSSTGVRLAITTPSATAGAVYKLTLQSQ